MVTWKKYQLFILMTCLVSVTWWGCEQKKPATKTTASEAEIRTLLTDYYDAMSARNWPAYRSFFSKDAMLTTIWQDEGDSVPVLHTTSITEFIARTGNGPDSQPIFEERMLGADVSVKKDLAQAWVDYEVRFGTEEQLMQWKGVDLFSFIRYQDEWKIVSIVFATD